METKKLNVNLPLFETIQSHAITFGLADHEISKLSELFYVSILSKQEDVFHLRNATTNEEISFPSQHISALLYRGSVLDDQMASSLRAWCADRQLNIALIDYDRTDLNFLSDLASQMSARSAFSASLIKQLAILRQTHEELQNSYDELRSFIADEGLLVAKMTFYSEPDPEQTVPADAGIIEQILPVEFRRLSGVSLFNTIEVPLYAEGTVQIELFSPDDDTATYTWIEPISKFKKGWITFVFEKQRGIFLRKNVAVRIIYKAGSGLGPVFAFGHTQIRSDKAAVIDGQPQTRALALKIYTSLAGAPLSVDSQMWPVIRLDGSPVTRLEFSFHNNLVVDDVLNIGAKIDFKPIVWDYNRRWILVHPISQSPTIAKLLDVCPKGTKRIVAEIETTNKKGGYVEYGIAIETAQNDGLAADAVHWTRLPPATNSEITLVLDQPLTTARSLLLFTRLPEGENSNFCWAHFKRIYFDGAF